VRDFGVIEDGNGNQWTVRVRSARFTVDGATAAGRFRIVPRNRALACLRFACIEVCTEVKAVATSAALALTSH
jgi:hypothetical protein